MTEKPTEEPRSTASRADVSLAREDFMTTLIRELSGTLQDVVGFDDASGFVSLVGQRMGVAIGDEYLRALGVERFDRELLGDVLVDLKRRIGGDFYVIEQNDERIVFGNRRCPFGDKVIDRPALCMMTSNVFGRIASSSLGYAAVSLKETIARGAPGCRVVVHLQPHASGDAETLRYYGGQQPGDPGTGDGEST